MKIKREGLGWRIARDLLLLSGLFLILMPLFLVVINSFKTLEEAGRNFFAFPSSFNLNNFKELFQNNNYWIFARNSLIISVISVTFILVLVPAVSYSIARNYTKRYYKSIYYYLLMGLFIPSQVIMLPVTKLMTNLNLLNRTGLILLYLAFSGCNVFQTYTRIVLPLIKPMISTLLIMDLLWIWNDFMLPLLILNRSQELWTLPLFQYNFKTEYSFDYTMAFTAYLMSMLPMLIVYCLGQKHIIKGLTAGSVKG